MAWTGAGSAVQHHDKGTAASSDGSSVMGAELAGSVSEGLV